MKAITVGKDQQLLWEEQPDPLLPPQHVMINVKAAGVNRADILQKKDMYPPPEGASEILGLELAGEIAELNGDRNWEVGSRVMALVPGGAYATKAIVPFLMILPIPSKFSFAQAAALPEAIYTSYLNLVEIGSLEEGETVLIHAGAGGIGSTAIQLAKALRAKVIATAGSEDKLEFCRKLGADAVINYRDKDFEKQLKEAAPQGIDLIFDTVGGSRYAALHPRLLNKYGRWVLIGLLGGRKAEIDLSSLLTKNITLTGSTLRSRDLKSKLKLTNQVLEQVLKYYHSGQIKPVLDKTFPITETGAAHKYLEENQVKGKVVLEME